MEAGRFDDGETQEGMREPAPPAGWRPATLLERPKPGADSGGLLMEVADHPPTILFLCITLHLPCLVKVGPGRAERP